MTENLTESQDPTALAYQHDALIQDIRAARDRVLRVRLLTSPGLTPDPRHMSIVATKLEEALLWAQAGGKL